MYQSWIDELNYCDLLLKAKVDDLHAQRLSKELAEMRLLNIVKLIDIHLKDSRRPEILRNGMQVTIFGPPNSGKSTFMNTLLRSEASKVSSDHGSTTEVIDQPVSVNGLRFLLTDSVGISKDQELKLKSTFSR